jgi:hypothetical protein
MSSSPSLLGRLFGALWRLIDAAYKLVVILLVVILLGGIWVALQGGPAPRMEDNVALVV